MTDPIKPQHEYLCKCGATTKKAFRASMAPCGLCGAWATYKKPVDRKPRAADKAAAVDVTKEFNNIIAASYTDDEEGWRRAWLLDSLFPLPPDHG